MNLFLQPKKTVTLIDSSWFMYRCLYSPQSAKVSQFVGDAYAGPSFLLYQSIHTLLRKNSFTAGTEGFENLIFVMDGWPKEKHEIFPNYKAQRKTQREKDKDHELKSSIRKQLRYWVIQTIPSVIARLPDEEADDCIGSLAVQLSAQGYDVNIISSDKDLWQLVSPKIHVWNIQEGQYTEIDNTQSLATFGVLPNKIPLYKAWFGDASDNLPKIHRMPSRLALPMIQECNTVEECVENIDKYIPKKDEAWKEKFLAFKDQAVINYKIACIKKDLKVPFGYFDTDVASLEQIFESYKIKSFSAQEIYGMMSANQKSTLKILVETKLLDSSNVLDYDSLIGEKKK